VPGASQFILVPHLSRGRCDRVVTSGLDPCDQAHGVDRTAPATLADARAFRIFNLLQQGTSLSDAETLVAAIFKVPSATAN
jgi:hypothetical protein